MHGFDPVPARGRVMNHHFVIPVWFCRATIFFVFVACFPFACVGEVTGDASLMDRVETLYNQNRGKLRKWNGEAGVKSQTRTTGPDAYELVQESAVSFFFDGDSGREGFSWEVTRSEASRPGELPIFPYKGHRIGGLVIGEDHYSFSMTPPDGRFTVTLIPTSPIIRMGSATPKFYPTFYFRLWDYEELPLQFADWRNVMDRSWCQFNISLNGDIVSVRVGNVTLPGVIDGYDFDLSQGGNVVAKIGIDNTREETGERRYENISGVFVPVYSRYLNAEHDGSKTIEVEVRWLRQNVNQTIPEETFTLDNIGVPPGAEIWDRRIDERYTFKPDEVQPKVSAEAIERAEQEKREWENPMPKSSERAWVAFGSLACLGLLVAVALFLRFRVQHGRNR